MDKRPWDGVPALVFGVILLLLGLSLLYQARHAGPAGLVGIKVDRGEPVTVRVPTALKLGIGLTLPGVVLTAVAFKRGIRVLGSSRPLPRGPILAGMFLFMVAVIAFWNFLLQAIP